MPTAYGADLPEFLELAHPFDLEFLPDATDLFGIDITHDVDEDGLIRASFNRHDNHSGHAIAHEPNIEMRVLDDIAISDLRLPRASRIQSFSCWISRSWESFSFQ